MAVTSLVLGIISLLLGLFSGIFGSWLGVIVGIFGIIFGAIARKKYPDDKVASGGLICSVIGTFISLAVFIACVACVGAIGAAGTTAY